VKKSYLFAFCTVFIWGTMASVVKLMLSEIPNLQALAVSSLFAFVFLLIMNFATGDMKKMRHFNLKNYGQMVGLGFLGLFLYSALYYYGIGQLTAQEACVLNYLWPIMLVVFSVLILHEPMTLKKGIAMGLSFLGVVILSVGNTGTGGGSFLLGTVSCIVAAVCYGLFSVLNKKLDMDQNITMMVIWLTVAVCAFAAGPFLEVWVPIKGMAWLGLLWLGVVIDAIAYLLWALALNEAKDSAKIANLAYLTPFLSILISAVFLGEQIKINAVLALLFIVGGILFQSMLGHR